MAHGTKAMLCKDKEKNAKWWEYVLLLMLFIPLMLIAFVGMVYYEVTDKEENWHG